MDQSGMRSIGYTDGVTFPIELTPQNAGPITLAGDLIIGVCEEICVPVQLTFDASLPADGKRDSAIVASLINRPLTASEGGVTAATCAIAPIDDGLTVTATLTLPATGGREVVVMEASDPLVWVSESDVTRSGTQITATSDMIHASAGSFALDRSALRFTVFGSNHVVDIQGCTGG
jgi:DsbC/DsbD-like thiol-disulfide interchange protein